MPFDGIVTANVVYDLNNLLQGGKIDKVYQPEHDEIVLSVHRGKEKHKVFITSNGANARIQMISDMPQNPTTPPAFCMLMRKHIQGGKIKEVVQVDTERIVEFCIDSFNEMGYPTTKKLIVEIMGKHSNITLTDDDKGTIIDSIKRISFDVNRYRQLLPGMKYVYPPSQDKISFKSTTPEMLFDILKNSQKTITKTLVSSIMGFSPFFAVSLCSMSGIQDDISCSILPDSKLKLLCENYGFLTANISEGHFSPCVWVNESKAPVDFHTFDHPDYSLAYTKISFDTIAEAQEYYYSRKQSTNRIRQKSADLDRIIKNSLNKLYLKKTKLLEDIVQAEDADSFRLKGEILFANLHWIKQGMSSITLDNYYNGEKISISLDPRRSPSDNAQRYYKKYNKMKTALTEKALQLDEVESELEYMESVAQLLESASDYNDVDDIRAELISGGYIRRRSASMRTKSSSTPPHQHQTSQGFKVLAGRNNKQNDQLTLKMAGSKDIWFHTKDIPGTHVILFTEGKEPTHEALYEAASIAAFYSKGKMSENVPVDYTLVKYVKKPSGAKPGMVIFTHNKTLYVNPKIPDESL